MVFAPLRRLRRPAASPCCSCGGAVHQRAAQLALLLATPTRRSSSGGGSGREERKVTVYTRTGDKGTSSLYNGTRQTKGSDIFHALGMTDSLNSHLGLARESCLPPSHVL